MSLNVGTLYDDYWRIRTQPDYPVPLLGIDGRKVNFDKSVVFGNEILMSIFSDNDENHNEFEIGEIRGKLWDAKTKLALEDRFIERIMKDEVIPFSVEEKIEFLVFSFPKRKSEARRPELCKEKLEKLQSLLVSLDYVDSISHVLVALRYCDILHETKPLEAVKRLEDHVQILKKLYPKFPNRMTALELNEIPRIDLYALNNTYYTYYCIFLRYGSLKFSGRKRNEINMKIIKFVESITSSLDSFVNSDFISCIDRSDARSVIVRFLQGGARAARMVGRLKQSLSFINDSIKYYSQTVAEVEEELENSSGTCKNVSDALNLRLSKLRITKCGILLAAGKYEQFSETMKLVTPHINILTSQKLVDYMGSGLPKVLTQYFWTYPMSFTQYEILLFPNFDF